MNGGWWMPPVPGASTPPTPPPLLAPRPTTWTEAEKRVEWVLTHLTEAELLCLYRLLYEARGFRIDGIRDRERKAKKEMT